MFSDNEHPFLVNEGYPSKFSRKFFISKYFNIYIMYMEDKRKRFLDKILNWMVDDTEVDCDNRTWLPIFLSDMKDFPLQLRPINITQLYWMDPITRFVQYCRETYDLTNDDISYLWDEYSSIIAIKINNFNSLNESENKLDRYFNYVSDDILKKTRHWLHPGNPLHIGVNFPMYNDEDLEFYYTEDEIEEWLHRGWLVGNDDIKSLMNHYGLTEDEVRRVMDMYGIKLATLLISKYGGK